MRALGYAITLSSFVTRVAAADSTPLHEPIFTETVTDIDAEDGGELEMELNVSSYAARRGSGAQRRSRVEIEYRATRAFGFLLEPGVEQSREGTTTSYRYDLDTGVALGLLHEGGFHLQLESGVRIGRSGRTETIGDAGLPGHADVRGALNLGAVTMRSSVGAEAGGTPEKLPFRASLAALAGIGDGHCGFAGVELEVDGARRAPYGVAADVVADLTPLGLPFRVGVGVPLLLGAQRNSPSFGGYLRLFWVSAREVANGKEESQ